MTPQAALELLKEGNARFQANLKANRNLLEQVNLTADGQFPFATILSCIAGNVLNDDIVGSMEFACGLAGSKLIVVLGHSGCGAVKGACDGAELGKLAGLLQKIRLAIELTKKSGELPRDELVQRVAEKNVEHVVREIRRRSEVLDGMIAEAQVGIVGAMYSVQSGSIEFQEMLCGNVA